MRPRPPAALTAEANAPPAANAIGAEIMGCAILSLRVSRFEMVVAMGRSFAGINRYRSNRFQCQLARTPSFCKETRRPREDRKRRAHKPRLTKAANRAGAEALA